MSVHMAEWASRSQWGGHKVGEILWNLCEVFVLSGLVRKQISTHQINSEQINRFFLSIYFKIYYFLCTQKAYSSQILSTYLLKSCSWEPLPRGSLHLTGAGYQDTDALLSWQKIKIYCWILAGTGMCCCTHQPGASQTFSVCDMWSKWRPCKNWEVFSFQVFAPCKMGPECNMRWWPWMIMDLVMASLFSWSAFINASTLIVFSLHLSVP